MPLRALFQMVTDTVYAAYQSKPIPVGVGTSYSFWDIMRRIVSYLSGAIGSIAVALFVAGALMIAFGGVKEDWKENGKKLMMGGALSLLVTLGAYGILRTVDFFLS